MALHTISTPPKRNILIRKNSLGDTLALVPTAVVGCECNHANRLFDLKIDAKVIRVASVQYEVGVFVGVNGTIDGLDVIGLDICCAGWACEKLYTHDTRLT